MKKLYPFIVMVVRGARSSGGIEMNASISKFLREEDGITALEYGILAALVATALGVTFLPKLKDLYATLFTTMSNAVANASG
ncbi:pilus assembly protein Flp/PilA [Rhodanobacter sp. ANJX3]|uniref:Flp family type IVb pilin n=1 Tax=unclassified Rhodanobacter TaxID=2621553 RepID=UPI0018115781|nr:pilus assembly protein Flp/PilA [Rhodanobacter sp. ANJX3]NYE28287.1 pilus assembly protein Flp/PilA [Rhodanobacter sp. K2T2]